MLNNATMKEKSTERITARVYKSHMKMLEELKIHYSINISQLMRGTL